MEDNRNKASFGRENQPEKAPAKNEHNPFKKEAEEAPARETPEEEASTEQQRKETLTERD